jgi:cytoskeletal protein CcmA (bactofilin family)
MSMRTADPSEYAATQATGANLSGVGNAESFSVIDRHTAVDGTFHANRDLRIEGEVKGTIECQGTLLVAQGANVTAKIEAENVTVAGDLNGEVNCRGRLQIMPSGRLHGKVSTQTLVINEGAYYEGQLEMARPEERTTGRSPRPLSPVSMTPQSNPGARRGTPSPSQSQAPVQPQSNQGQSLQGQGNSQTFIRRFGGPETPWSGESRDSDTQQPSETPPRDEQ